MPLFDVSLVCGGFYTKTIYVYADTEQEAKLKALMVAPGEFPHSFDCEIIGIKESD